MTAQRDIAIVIGAAVALFMGYGSVHLTQAPAKGNRLVATAPPVSPRQESEQPAVAVSPPPEPVAAGPTPAEPLVNSPPAKPKAKRKVRRKPEECNTLVCWLHSKV